MRATFDKSRTLELYARVGETPVPIVLTFLNENGSAHDISSYNFEFVARNAASSVVNLFRLTIGAGLTVVGAGNNQLRIAPEEANMVLKPVTNFYLLRATSEDHTWLNGPLRLHNGEFDGVEQTDDIVVTESGTPVTITITGTTAVEGSWVDCGTYDASGDVFPSTGGTGTSDAIVAFNTFVLSVGGVLGGIYFSAGSILVALVDDPGQTYTNWRIL